MKAKESTTHKPNDPPLWKTLFEFATIIIALYVAIVYSRQLDQMVKSNSINRDAVSINRDALHVVQRAFVYMPGLFVRTVSKDSKQVGLEIYGQWENSGNTPAIQVVQRVNWAARNDTLPDGFDFPDEKTVQSFHVRISTEGEAGFIAPHETILGGPSFISQGQLQSVNHGSLYIFFWGHVEYLDSFRCPHHTEFCKQIASFDGTSLTTASCLQHNCADEDCKNYQRPKNPACVE